MQVYRIGPARGAQRVGYARDPQALMAQMQKASPEKLTLWTEDVETGRAMLACRLFSQRFASCSLGDGWFNGTPDKVEEGLGFALADTTPHRIAAAVEPLTRARHVAAMLHLRTQVFDTTQEMMGVIAGRSAAIVSRWEAGATTPGLDELLRLRAYARAVGIPWEDSLLLDPPTT